MSLNVYYSPAKVNLRLEVLRKRCDGYHNIMSLVQPVNLYDEITIRTDNGNDIEVDTPNFPELKGEANLAYRAAEVFLAEAGLKVKVYISIDKSIPVAAGLGGGSSNAATVLKGLNSSLGSPLSQKRLLKIGRGIGADVPFFLWGRPAVIQGIGEIVEEVELPEIWYLIVDLKRHVSTESVYREVNLALTKKGVGINIHHLKRHLKSPLTIKKILYNDLEGIVCRKYPDLKGVKDSLIEKGALGSLVTGSGPTVFGIFGSRYSAEKTYDLLIDDFTQKGWSLFVTHGLN